MTIASILNEKLADKEWVIKTCEGLPDGIYAVREVRVDTDDTLVLYVGDFALRLRDICKLQIEEFRAVPTPKPAKPVAAPKEK